MGHANIGTDLRDRVAEIVADNRKREGAAVEVEPRDYATADAIIALVRTEASGEAVIAPPPPARPVPGRYGAHYRRARASPGVSNRIVSLVPSRLT